MVIEHHEILYITVIECVGTVQENIRMSFHKLTMNNTKKPIIYVCGFGWSGSGALTDLFRNNSHIVKPAGGEVIFYKGLAKIIRHLNDGVLVKKSSLASRILLGDIPNYLPRNRRDFARKKVKTLLNDLNLSPHEYRSFAKPVLNHLLHASQQIDARRHKTVSDDAEIRFAVSSFVSWIQSHLSSNDLCLHDNSIIADELSVFQYFDLDMTGPVSVFIVFRDPRDQFTEQLSKGLVTKNDYIKAIHNLVLRYPFGKKIGTSSPAVTILSKLFVKEQKRKIRQCRRDILYIKKLIPSININVVSFEDIVLSKNTRSKLRKDINMKITDVFPDNIWNDQKFFRPRESMRNIGKWKSILNPSAADFIFREISIEQDLLRQATNKLNSDFLPEHDKKL